MFSIFKEKRIAQMEQYGKELYAEMIQHITLPDSVTLEEEVGNHIVPYPWKSIFDLSVGKPSWLGMASTLKKYNSNDTYSAKKKVFINYPLIDEFCRHIVGDRKKAIRAIMAHELGHVEQSLNIKEIMTYDELEADADSRAERLAPDLVSYIDMFRAVGGVDYSADAVVNNRVASKRNELQARSIGKTVATTALAAGAVMLAVKLLTRDE